MYNLSRNGVIDATTGKLNVDGLTDTNPSDPKIDLTLRKNPKFFASWKYQCAIHKTESDEQINMVSINSWYVNIP